MRGVMVNLVVEGWPLAAGFVYCVFRGEGGWDSDSDSDSDSDL